LRSSAPIEPVMSSPVCFSKATPVIVSPPIEIVLAADGARCRGEAPPAETDGVRRSVIRTSPQCGGCFLYHGVTEHHASEAGRCCCVGQDWSHAVTQPSLRA
jgi:hypothetical protein